jgi:hypothetical protein
MMCAATGSWKAKFVYNRLKDPVEVTNQKGDG